MNAFFVGLQFLTRIKLVRQNEWKIGDFGKSVVYFPCVGLVIGLCLYGFYLLFSPHLKWQLLALLLMIFEFLLTGGLHADGYMDTCDGIFSGRDRERKLEIMKDSRVGANGVVAFVFLALLKWQLFFALPEQTIEFALILMPLLSRYGMTLSIRLFPYARPEGMGKAFASHSPPYTIIVSSAMAVLPLFYYGVSYLPFFGGTILVTYLLNMWITGELGGVTGDTYGFTCEVTELLFLLSVVLFM